MNIENIKQKIVIKKLNKELIIKIFVIIILVVLIIITSFNAGRKFFLLKNTLINNKKIEYNAKIARWNFKTEITVLKEEETLDEKEL